MKKVFFIGLTGGFLASCQVRAVHINSDPNQEHLERLEQKTEGDTIEVFIAQHPELDAQTKRDLRNGTISRSEVQKRLPK